jgi:hypothetical protein
MIFRLWHFWWKWKPPTRSNLTVGLHYVIRRLISGYCVQTFRRKTKSRNVRRFNSEPLKKKGNKYVNLVVFHPSNFRKYPFWWRKPERSETYELRIPNSVSSAIFEVSMLLRPLLRTSHLIFLLFNISPYYLNVDSCMSNVRIYWIFLDFRLLFSIIY